jgi:hypothetical protein
MPRRRMWVEWDDDAELSKSQKNPGAYSPLTRDGDGKLGHVTLDDVDEYEESLDDGRTRGLDADATNEQRSRFEDVATLAEILAPLLAAAKPHVARWWKDQARPTIKSTSDSARSRFARRRNASPLTSGNEADKPVDADSEDGHLSMSTDEAKQRLLAALVARAFSDEQVRLLGRARIEDAEGPLGFKSLMEQFTPQEIEGHVSLLMEANPALLHEFVSLFRGERIGDSAGLAPRGASDPKWRMRRRESRE